MFRDMQKKQGFTLIELLIVVVIIGILAAIAIPKFANTKEKATMAAAKTDLRNLVSAEEGYYADKGAYTATLASLNVQASKGVNAPTITISGSGYEANVTLTANSAKKCSVAVNGATNSVDATAIEGAPVCN